MHELSLLENVREILEEHALKQHFKHIKHVTLEVGALSCIEPDALRFGFDAVMKDSVAESAQLTILQRIGLGSCPACHQQTELSTLYDTCAHCGHSPLDITQGMDMTIKELIVI